MKYKDMIEDIKNLIVTVKSVDFFINFLMYKNPITSLPIFLQNIETIGAGAFNGCSNLALTSLPDGVTSIDVDAFSGCTNLALTSLPDGVTSIGGSAFSGCTNLALTSLPDGVKRLESRTFYNCVNMILTSLPESLEFIGEDVFWGVHGRIDKMPKKLTKLDKWSFRLSSITFVNLDGVIEVGDGAFGYSSLSISEIPKSVVRIDRNAFERCNISNLAFKGTPEYIDGTSFSSCPITDIYVPWAEGEVANAPWGATNATIHYNYIED